MKILLLTQVFPPRKGGSGQWLWELYRRLRDFDVHIVAGKTPGGEAFDRSRFLQIEGSSNKLGGRGPDREADAHARYGERIALAAQHQHALTAADSDDEPALGKDNRNLAGFRSRGCTDAN